MKTAQLKMSNVTNSPAARRPSLVARGRGVPLSMLSTGGCRKCVCCHGEGVLWVFVSGGQLGSDTSDSFAVFTPKANGIIL